MMPAYALLTDYDVLRTVYKALRTVNDVLHTVYDALGGGVIYHLKKNIF